MTGRLSLLVLAGLSLVFLLPSGAAQADAIDGNWCHREVGRMSIQGPEIVTPGGTQMQGTYGRHSFSYVVPAAEPGAGTQIFMVLVDEYTVPLTNGETTSSQPPQVWRRCPADIS